MVIVGPGYSEPSLSLIEVFTWHFVFTVDNCEWRVKWIK
jgi:hypothetical protein